MELVLFMGLQASGKSGFYRERFAATHVLVSKDLWPHARNKEARQHRLVDEALGQGRAVVVDNTHPLREDRAALIALGHRWRARVVGYAFASDLEVCLARNALREGRARVLDKALFITRRKLRWPSCIEGFDSLFHVGLAPVGGFHVREWRDEDETG